MSPDGPAAPPAAPPAPASPTAGAVLPDQGRERTAGGLPAWFPGWARRLADLYFSGTTSVFVLHGNTHDFVRAGDGAGAAYAGLAEFLAEQLFGRWDLVFHYDLGRGLRVFAGRDDARQRQMAERVNQQLFDLSAVKNDPGQVLALLDRFVRFNVMAAEEKRMSAAVLLDHASFLFPSGEPGRMSHGASGMLVTVLNWATSPYVKRANLAFALVDERLSDLSDRLTGNPHVATLEVPMPDAPAREHFIRHAAGGRDLSTFSDYGAPELAELTAGISLADVNVLIRSALESGERLDPLTFRTLKKRLIEKQCQGLLEFIEPKWNLDVVIGHEPVKARLREDAQLLRRGALDSLPMGYLLCGPVGTGKSFMAQCLSGEIGVPCVMLKNFRSKYVGETEGNLERVLSVLRAMGPVVVVVDEADAALGDREASGDSGTSSRVFSMIATQMGDTRYRGKILWMLLTARPDLLPIDLKRQGRAEVHIPLFYPTSDDELKDMFVTMAKKLGTKLAREDVPDLPQRGQLSGADVEGMVGRAWRMSLLRGKDHVGREELQEVVDQFLPSTQGLEKELQEIAAVIECTDRQLLPPEILKRVRFDEGRGRLQERLTELKRLVDAM
ncbi:MAG TPA: AAA family ATPase [Longimicrobiaceae bacterium]|nr:AAA family ATPase [Longimicrobiaceae bacterium]